MSAIEHLRRPRTKAEAIANARRILRIYERCLEKYPKANQWNTTDMAVVLAAMEELLRHAEGKRRVA